jgi:4-hydroxybenzoyl-CoA thioesterase/acyl-CoA thioester hydrolase
MTLCQKIIYFTFSAMAHQFQTRRTIAFSDTDMAGKVHFSRIFAYIEDAEHEFLRSLGLSAVLTVDGRVVGWPKVSAAFEFKNPVKFGDVLDLRLIVERLGKKSITYRVEIFNLGQPVGEGKLTSVCCEMREGKALKSLPIPDLFLEKIEEAPKAS